MFFRRKPTPATHAAPHAAPQAAEPPARAAAVLEASDDIVHPRELLQGTAHWFKEWFAGLSLDKDVLIHQIIERPGSRVLWALKLGRFPKTAQDALRDQNTVAGMLTWLYALGFVIALIAAA